MKVEKNKVSIKPEATIGETMQFINDNEFGIALVVDGEGRLMGTVTDGDIRRALLSGKTMDADIAGVMKKNPIVVPQSMTGKSIAELMRINGIYHLPVIDSSGKLVHLESERIYGAIKESLTAFIMAGGEGMRLRPLTENIPKPMLKVAGRPLLEIIIDLLKAHGFKNIILNIRYLGDIIEDYFKDGGDFGVNIKYITEPKPMGTAGSLSLLEKDEIPEDPFIVMNADILTGLNFKAFFDFHCAAKYDFTLCGRPYKVKIPFGYPIIEGDTVRDFREKPEFTHLVNSGIYCISPSLIEHIPRDENFNMPSLIKKACQEGKRVGVFPLQEKFHEIGRIETYKEAEKFYHEEMALSYINRQKK
ncbi:MAG: nucleotidyltransferase family protein [Candidatus Aureabacteria bacterium]|nr:nucleotidyltransferase family protein [Candidatus Auribacterota bacterium]